MSAKPTSSPFIITTYHATVMTLWYMPSSSSHAFISSCFTFVCLSLLLFSLHGLLIQPLWPQSILIGCSTRLMFSKECPYWMVLMLVYVETAEGLVKPLVILPAAVMPLTSFINIFSRCHRPLCSRWFIHSHNPLYPHLTLQTNPTLFIPFIPLLFPPSN